MSDITECNVNMNEIILTRHCYHCKEEFKVDDFLIGIGHPYYILLHKHCAPFFQYSKGWPHPKSFEFYKK